MEHRGKEHNEFSVTYAIVTRDLKGVNGVIDKYGLLYLKPWADFLGTTLNKAEEKIASYLRKKGDYLRICSRSKLHPITDGWLYNDMLCEAIDKNNAEIVRLLLQARALVKGSNDSNETQFTQTFETNDSSEKFLHKAVKKGFKEIVKLLLESGADINAVDKTGQTALSWAIYKEHWHIVRVLLSYDHNVDEIMGVVLHYDTIHQFDRITNILRKFYGLRPIVFPGDDDNVMFKAVCEGDITILQEILSREDRLNMLRKFTGGRLTPLHVAAFYQHRDIAKLLIKSGVPVLATDGWGRTIAHYILKEREDFEMLKSVMSMDECLKESGHFLVEAVRNKSPVFFDFLIKHDPNVFVRDSCDCTALHLACLFEYAERVKMLLECGSDPNALYGRQTALHFTLRMVRCKEIVELLLHYGADINFTDDHGDTALSDESFFCSWESYFALPKCLTPILYHILKLNAANLYISDKILECCKSKNFKKWYKSSARGFIHECKKEVERMKTEKIDDCSLSSYDILTASENRLVKLARNESLVQTLHSQSYKAKLPIYSEMIIGKLDVGRVRLKLRERCSTFLQNVPPRLPRMCLETIFDFLSYEDLGMLSFS